MYFDIPLNFQGIVVWEMFHKKLPFHDIEDMVEAREAIISGIYCKVG